MTAQDETQAQYTMLSDASVRLVENEYFEAGVEKETVTSTSTQLELCSQPDECDSANDRSPIHDSKPKPGDRISGMNVERTDYEI